MKITQLVTSIHGELPMMGKTCTLIRLEGCNLKCNYCDVGDVKGEEIEIEDLIDRVITLGISDLLITGGEPLLHKSELKEFLNHPRLNSFLVRERDSVVIETNGTLSSRGLRFEDNVFPFTIAWDLKHLNNIGPEKFRDSMVILETEPVSVGSLKDVVKVVFQNQDEFDFFKAILEQIGIRNNVPIVFSPSWDLYLKEEDRISEYVDEVIKLQKENIDKKIYFQLQIHKCLQIA